MALSYKGVGSWANSAAATITVTLPTHAAGDMLIVRAIRKPFTNPDTIVINTTGWAATGTGFANGSTANGLGVGSMAIKTFYKIAESSAETNPVVTWTTSSAPGGVVAVVYQKDAGDTWVTPVGAGGGNATAATTVSETISGITTAVGDFLDLFVGWCDDSGTPSAVSVNQSATGFAITSDIPATALDSGTSNDIAADGGYAEVVSGGNSNDITVTASYGSSEQHIAWVTRLRVISPTITRVYAQAQAQIIVPSTTLNRQAQAQAFIITGYGALIRSDNPFAYWRFAEPSGSTVAYDSIGTNDGVYSGAVTLGATGALIGDSNTAVSFDNSNEYINVPYDSSLNLVTNFTIEAWIKWVSGNKVIVSRATEFGAPSFWINTSVLSLDRNDGGGTEVNSGTTLVPSNEWVHVVVTYGSAANSSYMYINGIDVTNHPGTGVTFASGTSDFNIAHEGGAYALSPASIDEVALYNYALTRDQVEEHFLKGAGYLSRRGQAQAYIYVPFGAQRKYAQAQAHIKASTSAIAQAQASISNYKVVIDTFTRTLGVDAWGTPDTGPTWIVKYSNGNAFSVNGTHGLISQDDNGWGDIIKSPVALRDVSFLAKLKIDTTTGSNSWLRFATRGLIDGGYPDGTGYYFELLFRSEIDTKISCVIGRVIEDVDTQFSVVLDTLGTTYQANTDYYIRIENFSNILRYKIWLASSSEPDIWTASTTDSAITGGGNVTIRLAGGGTGRTISFDEINIKTYSTNNHAQAQASIRIVASASAQAQAVIKQTYQRYGQASVWIKQTYPFGGGGGGIVAQDSFTETSNTYIYLHTPEVGGPWVARQYGEGIVLATTDVLSEPSGSGPFDGGYNLYSVATLGDGYAQLNTNAETRDGDYGGPYVRQVTDNLDTYYVVYGGSLYRVTNGASTSLGSVGSSGNWYRIQATGSSPTYLKVERRTTQGALGTGWNLETSDNTTANQVVSGYTGIQTYSDSDYLEYSHDVDDFLAVAAEGSIVGPTFAQAQAIIVKSYQVVAQSIARIKSTYTAHAQALTAIKSTYRGYAQTQTRIKQTYRGHAQANAQIKQTYRGYGQARTQIRATYTQNAQSQAHIKITGYSSAQASVVIARLVWSDTFSRTVAQGIGEGYYYEDSDPYPQSAEVTYVDGNALVVPYTEGTGAYSASTIPISIVEGVIKFDIWIPNIAFATNAYVGVGLKVPVSANNNFGTRFSEIGGVLYLYIGTGSGSFTDITAYVTPGNWHTVKTNISRGSGATKIWKTGDAEPDWIDQHYEAPDPLEVQGFASLHVSAFSTADIKLDNLEIWSSHPVLTLIPIATVQAQIKQTYQSYGQAQAQISAQAEVTQVVAQAQASVKTTSQGYAQSRAQIKATYQSYAQAQAHVKNTYTQNAQANARIKQIYQGYAQSQARVKNTYRGVAQGQARIKNTYTVNAQAQVRIKQTYYGAAQARTAIKTTYRWYAQAQSDIKATYIKVAQSQAQIKSTYRGFAQANAQIKTTYTQSAQSQAQIRQSYTAQAQSQAYIKLTLQAYAQAAVSILATSSAFGQANAQILGEAVVNKVYAQAQSQIKATSTGLAQAQTQIRQTYQNYAQARTSIKQTYRGYAQAQTQIKTTYRVHSQAQTQIKNTYQVYGQTQARIRQTYRGYAQAQTTIKQTSLGYAQARAQVKVTTYGFAQAQAQIKAVSNNFAQAQATISAKGNGHAQALVYIYIPVIAYPVSDISNNGWVRVVI